METVISPLHHHGRIARDRRTEMESERKREREHKRKLNKVNKAVKGCSTPMHFSKNAHIVQDGQNAIFQYAMRHDSGQRKSV